MQNLNKVINDFKAVEEDLQELMKTKDFDHKRFFDTIYQNIAVWRCKTEYFFNHVEEYTKELEKELEKEDRKTSKGNH